MVVQNFGPALQDPAVFAALTAAVTRKRKAPMPIELVGETQQACQDEVLERFATLEFPPFLCAQHAFSCAAASRKFALVAYLFCHFPSLHHTSDAWDATRSIVEDLQRDLHTMSSTEPNSISLKELSSLGTRLKGLRHQLQVLLEERQHELELWQGVHERVLVTAFNVLLQVHCWNVCVMTRYISCFARALLD